MICPELVTSPKSGEVYGSLVLFFARFTGKSKMGSGGPASPVQVDNLFTIGLVDEQSEILC